MDTREFAGKIDFLVFILVVLGSLYFFASGYPLYLAEKYPLMNEIWAKVAASASIAVGMIYIFVVAVTSFFRSVRKLEAVFETEEKSESKAQ